MELDCRKCGACCAGQLIVILSKDKGIPLHMRSSKGSGLVMQEVNNRCVALEGKLGQKVRCAIYHQRPDMCSTMRKGTDQCLLMRSQWGMDFLPKGTANEMETKAER